MKLLPLNKFLFIAGLALGGGLAAMPAAAQDDPLAADGAGSRHARIRKLQVMSRVFQICYGRTLKKDEAAGILAMSRDQIVASIRGSAELTAVFAARLANFAKGGESSSNNAAAALPATLAQIARPEAPLDVVLKNLASDRHSGASCGGKPTSVCFAHWLVGRVAPALGADWVTKNEANLSTWSYAQLLEQLSTSSL